MFEADSVVDIAGTLQEAALDPALWPKALDRLSRATGSVGGVLIPIEKRVPGLPCSPAIEDLLDGYFKGGWHLCDERYRGVPIMMRRGVVTEADFIDEAHIARSPYYRRFLESYRLRWFAGLGFTLGGEFWCVSLQRRIDQGPYGRTEIEGLERLLVPLHDAATVCRTFSSARLTGMMDAFELMRQPGVILDDRARIVAINTSAEAILAGSIDGRDRKITFRDAESADNFDHLMKVAIKTVARLPGDALTTIRDKAGGRHVVRAVVLGTWTNLLFTGARVLLLLRSMSERAKSPVALQAVLGLTAAEARLAAALLSGNSIRGIAASLGITYETARSTLKVVYEKTGVGRQTELISLLAKFDI